MEGPVIYSTHNPLCYSHQMAAARKRIRGTANFCMMAELLCIYRYYRKTEVWGARRGSNSSKYYPRIKITTNWNLAHVLSSHHPSVTVVCFLHGGEPTHPNLFHSREYHWATTHTTWSFQYQQLAILRRLCFKRDKTTLAPLLLEQSKTLHSLKHYKTCL